MQESQFDLTNGYLIDQEFTSATIRRAEPTSNLSKTQLVFMPGFAHNERFFDIWNAESANKGFDCLAVNYRNNKLKPLTHAEVNKHSITEYKNAVLAFISEAYERYGKSQVLVHHSMASRIIYELHSENKLPKSVRGLVFLNPVPNSSATLFSSIKGLFSHWLNNLMEPAPLQFISALLRRKVSDFLVHNPELFFKLFFSSSPEEQNFRLSSEVNADIFIKSYLCPESSRATASILIPSFRKVRSSDLPMLFIATDDDHVTRAKDVEKFFHEMKNKNNSAKFVKIPGSHEMPMDIAGIQALEAIREFTNKIS